MLPIRVSAGIRAREGAFRRIPTQQEIARMRIPHNVVRLLFLISVGWFVLSRPLLRSQSAPAIASTDIMIQRGVPMKTRDGVTLYADIYRPKSAGGFRSF
jgi:predicted acyl esterase